MLNPRGVHELKDTFLKLFIEPLNKTDSHFNFDTTNCQIFIEKKVKDGRIDILIQENNSDENAIVIENKIHAPEQPNQLLRYRKAFPKGKLLFLTLDTSKSEQESAKDTNYIPISYRDDIISWLEKCKKEAVNNPTLRETLTQYINLIKKLTNQNINSDMNIELIDKILENPSNYEAFQAIDNVSRELQKYIIENKVIPIIKKITKNSDLKVLNLLTIDKGHPRFHFFNEEMRGKGIEWICFASGMSKSSKNIRYGFLAPIDKDDEPIIDAELKKKINDLFRDKFDKPLKAIDNWIASAPFDGYNDWENFDTLKEIYFHSEDFENVLKDKVVKMLEIIKKLD